MKNDAGERKNLSQGEEAATAMVCFWAKWRVAWLDQQVQAGEIKEINISENSFERCIRIYNFNTDLHICDSSKPNSSFDA